MMLLSDIHNNILKGCDAIGSLHFLNEPAFLQAIRGIECYSQFYSLIHGAQSETRPVDEMDDETFHRVLLSAAAVATAELPEASGATAEMRLNVILANMVRDEDFVAFDNVDHGLFQLH